MNAREHLFLPLWRNNWLMKSKHNKQKDHIEMADVKRKRIKTAPRGKLSCKILTCYFFSLITLLTETQNFA